MFLDALGLLSDAQAITVTAVSTNTIDLSSVTPSRDIGVGEPMVVGFALDAAADFTTGDETYEFQVIQSANADLSSPDVIATRTILAAALLIGHLFDLPIPQGALSKRYLGARYVTAGNTPTITVTAMLSPRSMFSIKPRHNADAITIS